MGCKKKFLNVKHYVSIYLSSSILKSLSCYLIWICSRILVMLQWSLKFVVNNRPEKKYLQISYNVKLNFSEEQLNDFNFNMLSEIGFSSKEIDKILLNSNHSKVIKSREEVIGEIIGLLQSPAKRILSALLNHAETKGEAAE